MNCYNSMSTCNTCYQSACSCPQPTPPVPVPAPRTCTSPFDFFFGEILNCYIDQPCQNTNCTSPLIYAINTAVAQATTPSVTDIVTSWNTLMDGGIVMSNTGNKPFCCPGCCGDEIYYLGGATKYLLVQNTINYPPNCCLNFRTNATVSTTINNFFNNKNWSFPVKCDNNFEACVNLLFSKVNNQAALLTAGIVELPTAGYGTEVCNLINTLTAITPALSSANLGTFVSNLMTKGFVYGCYNGQIFIGSTDAFITWNNAN